MNCFVENESISIYELRENLYKLKFHSDDHGDKREVIINWSSGKIIGNTIDKIFFLSVFGFGISGLSTSEGEKKMVEQAAGRIYHLISETKQFENTCDVIIKSLYENKEAYATIGKTADEWFKEFLAVMGGVFYDIQRRESSL